YLPPVVRLLSAMKTPGLRRTQLVEPHQGDPALAAGLVVAVVLAVGGQRGPGAVVVLAVEDLGLRPEAPVLGADEQFAVPITRGEVEVPVRIARGARERRDHNASPFGA